MRASLSARHLLRVLACGPRNLHEWRDDERAGIAAAADELSLLGLALRSPDSIIGVTRRGRRALPVMDELSADELGLTADELTALRHMSDGDSAWAYGLTAHGLLGAGAVTVTEASLSHSDLSYRVHVTKRGRELITHFADDFQVHTALQCMDD